MIAKGGGDFGLTSVVASCPATEARSVCGTLGRSGSKTLVLCIPVALLVESMEANQAARPRDVSAFLEVDPCHTH